jgi:hypothetical protein
MQKSELLTTILNDYAVEHKSSDAEKTALTQFCDYAAQWLISHGCLGLGHASHGLNLRFADGSELILFSAAPDAVPVQTDVQIGGTSTKLAVNTPQVLNTSFQITGR